MIPDRRNAIVVLHQSISITTIAQVLTLLFSIVQSILSAMDDMEHTHFVYVCTKSTDAAPFSSEQQDHIVDTVTAAVAAETKAIVDASAAAALGGSSNGCGAAESVDNTDCGTAPGCGSANALQP
jgi:hypothetical protein